ncbi:MAG: ATP-binding protein, partial [Bacteroides sp.]|nr:ATP-binding protein [Bacteroides sp.]
TIINKCCQIGLETVQIDREVTLQDNKRTDLLIRFGLCNPIMVELKLLNNEEIQNDEKRREYKGKFVQYLNATNASLAVFWIFDVHRKKNNDRAKFDILKSEYMDLPLTKVILSDCKCSSSMETGISKPRKQSKQSKKASKGKK